MRSTDVPERLQAATVISAGWRGARCRLRLRRARALPTDLWLHVLRFLRGEDPQGRMERAVSRLVSVRVLRIAFAPPTVLRRDFPRVVRLVRTYASLLSARTLRTAARVSLRILSGAARHGDPGVWAANVFLEWLDVRPDAKGLITSPISHARPACLATSFRS